MRMRRKKHLGERFDACSELTIDVVLDSFNIKENNFEKKLSFSEIFGNNNPVHLEIGCGKGQFVIQMAKRHPEINFIAVEKTQNVIVSALESALKEDVKNVRFINCGVEYLDGFFPYDSIDRIYLNFSCPYPKNKYEKHRLTHSNFLKLYEKLLKPQCEIHLKTDNSPFFEYSINSLSGFGFTLKKVTFDLHRSDFTDNIMTEYEKRFSEMGLNIFRLEAFLNNSSFPTK